MHCSARSSVGTVSSWNHGTLTDWPICQGPDRRRASLSQPGGSRACTLHIAHVSKTALQRASSSRDAEVTHVLDLALPSPSRNRGFAMSPVGLLPAPLQSPAAAHRMPSPRSEHSPMLAQDGTCRSNISRANEDQHSRGPTGMGIHGPPTRSSLLSPHSPPSASPCGQTAGTTQ